MTSYNARIEFGHRMTKENAADLVDELDGYAPVVSAGPNDHLEVIVTLNAQTLRQAASSALAIVEAASGRPAVAIEALSTDEFDRRVGLAQVPQLMSVSDAAAALAISRQAVLQRIDSGSLPARKVGNAWVVRSDIIAAIAASFAASVNR